MSAKRIGILLWEEILKSPRNFMFVYALIIPVVLSLMVTLLFGSLFAGRPRIGFSDAGDSQLVTKAEAVGSFVVREYDTAVALKEAVTTGAIDLGFVLPAGFDEAVRQGNPTEMSAYIWGESLLKDRAVLGFTTARLIREIAGEEAPVRVVARTLGDAESIPWEERLLPLLVLMALFFGGAFVPATSLVEEKTKRTLNALNVTPTTLGDVFAAKGILGTLVSLTMAMVVLLLNRAVGDDTAMLLLVLGLGALMASNFGLLLGAFVKDITSLFATVKALGLLLYAPALINLFPTIPQWIGQLFPTYYMVQPVIKISQQGASLNDIVPELLVLVVLNLVLVGIIAFVIQRSRRTEFVLAP